MYPAGRLDYDSEGLLALTDFGPWQARISQPGSGLPKTYLVQVEGEPQASQVARLRAGVMLPDGPALPANADAAGASPVAMATRSADPPPS